MNNTFSFFYECNVTCPMIKYFYNWIFQAISLILGTVRAPDAILAFFGSQSKGGGKQIPKESKLIYIL